MFGKFYACLGSIFWFNIIELVLYSNAEAAMYEMNFMTTILKHKIQSNGFRLISFQSSVGFISLFSQITQWHKNSQDVTLFLWVYRSNITHFSLIFQTQRADAQPGDGCTSSGGRAWTAIYHHSLLLSNSSKSSLHIEKWVINSHLWGPIN